MIMMLEVIQNQDEHINEKLQKLEKVDETLKSNISRLDANFNSLMSL